MSFGDMLTLGSLFARKVTFKVIDAVTRNGVENALIIIRTITNTREIMRLETDADGVATTTLSPFIKMFKVTKTGYENYKENIRGLETEKKVELKPKDNKGAIAGYIIYGDTQAAAEGISVSVSGPVSKTVTTGVFGEFRIKDLPEGVYTLSISSPPYLPVSKSVTVTKGVNTNEAIALVRLVARKI